MGVTWEIEGIDNWRSIPNDTGLIIAVKHAHYSDEYVIYEIAHRIGVKCFYVSAPEVFEGYLGMQRFFVRSFGGFPVERGGKNIQAARFTIETLKKGKVPIVLFPEGELFFLNDYVTPLKQGTALFALEGAKARTLEGKPNTLFFLPIGLKYLYEKDINPLIKKNLAFLEKKLLKTNLKKGDPSENNFSDRIEKLMNALLAEAEKKFNVAAQGQSPEEKFLNLSLTLIEALETATFGKTMKGELSDRARIFMARSKRDTESFKKAFWALYSLSFLPGYMNPKDQNRVMETIRKINRLVTENETPPFPGHRLLRVKIGRPFAVQPYLKQYLKSDTKKEGMQNLLTDLRATIQKIQDELA